MIYGLLSVIHVNDRSIVSKLSQLENLLTLLPVDILAVTETWLDTDLANNIHIPGYNFEFKCRATGRGGGVGCLIKEHINYQKYNLPSNCSTHLTYESLFLRFSQPNGSYFLTGIAYRPPGQDLDKFNNEWNLLLAILQAKTKDIYIMGDFNIDLLKAQDHRTTLNFLDTMSSYHFLPVITQPTRITLNTATLIDNFFTNRTSKIIDSAIIVEDISDHLPIMTWIDITPKLNVNPNSLTDILMMLPKIILNYF
jgi:exonuclease III